MSAGHSALSAADSVLKDLDDADSWNTFDMIGGGGIITHIAKHSHLDSAQDMIEYLQGKLCTFKSELADINIQAYIQVKLICRLTGSGHVLPYQWICKVYNQAGNQDTDRYHEKT